MWTYIVVFLFSSSLSSYYTGCISIPIRWLYYCGAMGWKCWHGSSKWTNCHRQRVQQCQKDCVYWLYVEPNTWYYEITAACRYVILYTIGEVKTKLHYSPKTLSRFSMYDMHVPESGYYQYCIALFFSKTSQAGIMYMSPQYEAAD